MAARDIPVAPAAPHCFPLGAAHDVENAGRGLLEFVDPLAATRKALAEGDHHFCADTARADFDDDTHPGLAADGWWLRAQCSLHLDKRAKARKALVAFTTRAKTGDPRLPIASTQLSVLDSGALPEGLRLAPYAGQSAPDPVLPQEQVPARDKETGGRHQVAP